MAASNRGHRAIIRDGENGFLVPLNDAEAMAERVEALMDSPELYERMSHIDVRSYSCDSVAAEIEQYLIEVLNQ